MPELINSQTIVNAAETAATGRFVVEKESADIATILAASDDNITDKAVLRLKRVQSTAASQRTVLITVLNTMDDYAYAKRWAAVAREELLDPELADLYLIAALQQNNLTVDKCTSLEANEQFCRKYFLRPSETPEEMIQRTFLGNMNDEHSSEELADPLRRAFEKTATSSDWLNEAWRTRWKTALLSGKNGSDLIDDMFQLGQSDDLIFPSNLDPETNETPDKDNAE